MIRIKKDNIRDYAAEAFRYYALCRASGAAPPDDPGALADLAAVEKVVRSLEPGSDGELAKKCLELVYFTQPARVPGRGALSDRVRYAAHNLHLSDRGVYRILRGLRVRLALERGLRVGK